VKAVVLDLGGTLVDGQRQLGEAYEDTSAKGDKIPVVTLIRTFKQFDMHLDEETVREGIGFSRDHLRSILTTEAGKAEFRSVHGRDWTEEDVSELYEVVRDVLREHITDPELAAPIDGAAETVSTLRESGRKLGCTTGFPGESAEAMYDYLDTERGIELDFGAYPDLVRTGRPQPWMVQRNMRELDVYPPGAVLKVGDKPSDVAEGRNAGVWTAGVYATGHGTYEQLHAAGADYLVPSVGELPTVVRSIEGDHLSN
jgi:phosphonoacetaldehyde hydrolase